MARKLVILFGALALALALPAAARAATFCVKAPGCAGEQRDSVSAALSDADTPAFPGADRIEVGPGEYTGPFSADGDNPVDVVGAGRGRTLLTATENGATVLGLAAPGSSVRGLTVRLGSGSSMTGLTAPHVEAVAVDGTGSPATGFVGVRAAGALAAENVTIELNGAATSAGVQVGPGASATLRHLTISGAGEGIGLAVIGAPLASSATAMLRDSVIRNIAQHIVTTGLDCTPQPCSPSTATVTTAYSAYDKAKVTSTGPGGVTAENGTPEPIGADPRLRDDLRPRYDSPLVDAGDPAAGGGTDASGAARVVDGNGDGAARRDIGALEYQRRPPQITSATAAPGSAAVGVPIAFSAAASDADDETVTAVWTFSDGSTATGFDVSHAFGAPGAASAKLTVTDAAGVTASTSVAATIDAAPSGPGPLSGPKPRVIARVFPAALKLRAGKRRDRRAPYRFKLRGRIVLPAGINPAGCAGGRADMAIRAGKRRMTKSARVAADCSFRLTLKLGRKRAKRVVVTPSFSGTLALAPREGDALRLRAG